MHKMTRRHAAGVPAALMLPAVCVLGLSSAAGASERYILETAAGQSFAPRLSADGSTVILATSTYDNGWSGNFLRMMGPLPLTWDFPGEVVTVAGVSGDGSTFVVTRESESSRGAYVWTYGPGFQSLGVLDESSPDALARAMSRDGTVIVGESMRGDEWRAFGWTGGTMEALPNRGWAASYARAVSGDGSVIAGEYSSEIGGNSEVGVIWRNGVATEIGTADQKVTVAALSLDGTSVIGTHMGDVKGSYRWRDGEGIVDLGALTEWGGTVAYALSANGDVVVGTSQLSRRPVESVAVIWTEADGLRRLDDAQQESGAYAISDDGTRIAGYTTSHGSSDYLAVRWVIADGDIEMQLVTDLLRASDVDTGGLELLTASQISADGNTMAGWGYDEDLLGMNWVVRCVDGCALVTDVDAAQSVAGLGRIGEAGNLYLDITFDQLGHVLGADTEGSRLTLSGVHDTDPVATAFAALSHRNADGLAAALALGAALIDTPLPQDGQSMMHGAVLSGSVGHRGATGLDWRASAGAMGFAGSIARGYHNGADPVRSTGETGGHTLGGEIELGWRIGDAATSLRPHLGASLAATALAGYTESGGPFPARVGDIETVTALVRAGLEVSHRLETGIVVEAGAALVHRQSGGPDIAVDIPGAFALALPGATGPRQWAEMELGARLPLAAGEVRSGLMLRVPDSGAASYVANVGFSLPL